MYPIISQPLTVKHHAPILSRGFFLTSICYLMTFIIPVLILVTIDYSITENKKALLKPIIKFQNYQSACLMKDLTYKYDSSFGNDQGFSQSLTVSVGTDANTYSISANIWGDTLACTILTYNRVILNGNTEVLTTIPFNFYQKSASSSVFLQSITQMGKIEVFYPSQALQQSVNFTQNEYHSYNSYSPRVLLIDQAPLQYSQKNISAIVSVAYRNEQYAASAASVTKFEGKFQIQSEIYIASSSLLDKARQFVPYFIYLWLPLLWFIIQPVINWMLENRIYSSRWQGVSKLKAY